MKFNVVNRCQEDLSSMHGLLKSFLPFARKRMGFNKPPTIHFQSDEGNASKLLGKTAHYDPTTMNITVYVTGRHPKDVLRSLSHELVHHGQNCRGEFSKLPDTAPGYAQNDSHLRGMEEEAYKVGNLCFRDWEDSVKSGKIRVPVQIRESLIREEVTKHTVTKDDTLYGIAEKYYQDGHKWPIIYIKNKQIIGSMPDLIKKGQVFEIPDVSEWDKLSDSDIKSIYSLSNFYKDSGSDMVPTSKPETFVTNQETFQSYGDPASNAEKEYEIWGGTKETDPRIKNRLAAMWSNVGWRSWALKTPWSAAAISWFFRDFPGFKKSSAHRVYINDAKRRRKNGQSGYQHFTPQELNYNYQRNDIIGYVPKSYGKVHCDIYIGNDECIGGNLSDTVRKNKIVNNKVSGNEIILVLRYVGTKTQTLEEWKNAEINRLLLEKFNFGDKK